MNCLRKKIISEILRKTLLLGLLTFGVSLSVFAEPSSSPFQITSIRAYVGGAGTGVPAGTVFIATDNPNGTFCGQSVYAIDGSQDNAKALLAVALTALATGKTVILELTSGFCPTIAGYNTLRSLSINR